MDAAQHGTGEAALAVEVRALYALPRTDFVGARNARAKELRAAGDRQAADELKQVPKPSLVAWAVNAAARREPDTAADLVSTVEDLQRAGSGDPRELGRRHAALVDRLTRAAAAGLRDAGEAATPERLSQVASAIRAAALAGDRTAFLEGRLGEQPEGADDSLAAALAAGAHASPRAKRPAAAGKVPEATETATGGPGDAAPPPPPKDERASERRRLRAELAGAKVTARTAKAELRDAERELRAAERALEELRDARERAASRSTRAATIVGELQAEVEALD